MYDEKVIIIDGMKTDYTVTTEGDVYSLNYNKTGKKKKLKPYKDKDGYYKVNLHINKKVKSCSIARLVALSFIPNDDPDNKTQVNHKKGYGNWKRVNTINNLEWVTPSENIHHAYRTGLANSNKGIDSKNSVLTEEQVRNICKELSENKLTIHQISDKFNVDMDNIRNIKYGRTWKHISKDYNIESYTKSKFLNEDIVENICHYLETTELSLQNISDLLSIPFNIIKSIYYKQTWKNISSKYNFKKHSYK